MKKEPAGWLIFISALTFLQALYVYAFFIEPNWIAQDRVPIVSGRLSRALSGVRIVQISDLHTNELGYREISLIEQVNRLKPDIVLVTGDMIASREGVTTLWNTLSLLEPKFHTYAVFGDREGEIMDLKDAPQWDRANTYLLTGRAIRMNVKGKPDTAFWLIGADYNSFPRALASGSADEPKILLSHWPDNVKEAAIAGIDLVLSGHTHGGQVGLPFLHRFFPYAKHSEYLRGLYKVRNTLLYVNRGVGSEKSIRLFCRPEITVFDFRPDGDMRYTVLPQDQ